MTMPRPTVSAGGERIHERMAAYVAGDAVDGGWVLLHLCEARARASRKVQDAVRHDDRGSGRRRMHNPRRAPDWYLPRFRDLVGNDDEGLTGDALRTSIAERPRARRCTHPALQSAVLRTLAPGAAHADVRVVERYGGSPYGLGVLCRTAHVIDADASYRAARQHKPLFVKLTFLISNSPTWDEATRTWNQAALGATWDSATPEDVT